MGFAVAEKSVDRMAFQFQNEVEIRRHLNCSYSFRSVSVLRGQPG